MVPPLRQQWAWRGGTGLAISFADRKESLDGAQSSSLSDLSPDSHREAWQNSGWCVMSSYMLSVPEEIYNRACRIAAETAQPVEQVLLAHLKNLHDPWPSLPPDEQEELEALHHLSDDALWTIAREQMPNNLQERLQLLMDKNSLGTIRGEEYQELAEYVARGNRLMVRKAEAAGILVERGHVFTQKDFQP